MNIELKQYQETAVDQLTTWGVRKLTPIECERLQGLKDRYSAKGMTDKGVVDISNTQRYKALGNAFNVDVVAHILKYLHWKEDTYAQV